MLGRAYERMRYGRVIDSGSLLGEGEPERKEERNGWFGTIPLSYDFDQLVEHLESLENPTVKGIYYGDVGELVTAMRSGLLRKVELNPDCQYKVTNYGFEIRGRGDKSTIIVAQERSGWTEWIEKNGGTYRNMHANPTFNQKITVRGRV